MKKASIIIPIYNAERFLKETIDSVLNQTFSNFEVILVNDGSIDSSDKICKSYSDNRIIYLEIPNGGVSNARNIGFQKSSGGYLAFLDADDVWMHNRLEKTIDFLDSHKSIGLVHTHVQVIDIDSNLEEKIFKGKEGFILDDLLKWKECCIPAPSSILVRKRVLEKIGLFDLQLSTAADHDIFFRIAKEFEIGMIPEVLGLYRIHDTNMHMNISRMENEHVYLYKKAKNNQLFRDDAFRKECFANLYRVLSGSYWVNAKSWINAVRCGLISLYYRPNLSHFFSYKKIK